MTVVEAERELIEIEREIFGRDFMKYAHDSTLEQGPDVLDAVNVDRWVVKLPILDVGLSVFDPLMSEFRTIQPIVSGQFVGMDFDTWRGMTADEGGEAGALHVAQRLHADLA